MTDNAAATSVTVHGSCLCGAVQFTAGLPQKWCAHCHCTMCRRHHGAGYVTWVGFHAGQVEIADPESNLRWHESSPGARRGFCGVCGSSLFFEAERWAGETHVALGCIDEPHPFVPTAHAFYDTHVTWMAIDGNLKTFS